MKLYRVPKNTMVDYNGEKILFRGIDGTVARCTDSKGEVVWLKAWAEVEVLGDKIID